ncbi:hypothetical protein DPMN_157008 [Dreissena polymorpha]|uniref:VWFD domain-containing protein n=1 Tax=Dreissena polymorpha TaxID=45954 RepID=A0A9D4FPY8_DREPO|nr:hypothetical protein DPMN_157008 [Dreissena polymorpha]
MIIIIALPRNSTFNPDIVYTFPIVTVDERYTDEISFQLDIRFPRTKHGWWSNYVLPSVKVIVDDDRAYEYRTCHSHIDPHMKTIDGLYYEQQHSAGAYMLYWNTFYDIEVQQKTHDCWGVAICACGVAVRAGKDVFMINKCGGLNYMDFTQCGEGGILEVIPLNSGEYRILTPIGTKIQVSVLYDSNMNIEIIMAPKDFNNTDGLCGSFDNDTKNDFKHYNSNTITDHTTHHPNEFSDSWNMELTSDEIFRKKNLFREANRTLEYWKTRNQMYLSKLQRHWINYPNEVSCKNWL